MISGADPEFDLYKMGYGVTTPSVVRRYLC